MALDYIPVLFYNSFIMTKPSIGTVEYEIEKAKETGQKRRLLLHACCGPCSTSVLDYLHDYFDITVYFYNPNILPKEEFIRRLEALKTVISHFSDVKLIVPEYNPEEYLPYVKGMENLPEGQSRCSICFDIRLGGTAAYFKAHENEFDFFATTLTVSPHKNHILINETGNRIAEKFGIQYLDSNFKKKDGYLKSCQLSKKWGIYRQDYCGCRFD